MTSNSDEDRLSMMIVGLSEVRGGSLCGFLGLGNDHRGRGYMSYVMIFE